MARARFIAVGHHGLVCEAFGRKFPHGEWVELKGVSDKHVEVLAANPTFEVELDGEPPAPKPKAAATGKSAEA